MRVEYYNVDGKDIEEFNIYNLKVGKDKSICPKCSHTRRKKNLPCASVDWITHILTCHHCGVRLRISTFKKEIHYGSFEWFCQEAAKKHYIATDSELYHKYITWKRRNNK